MKCWSAVSNSEKTRTMYVPSRWSEAVLMSGRPTWRFKIDGSSLTATRRRSVAKRIAPYSRSTALSRPIQVKASSGMGFHLVEHLPKRRLRQGLRLGLADVADSGCPLKQVVNVPPIVVIVQAGNVVVGRHQVKIDNAFRTRSGSRDGLQEQPNRLFLKEKTGSLVVPDLGVLHLLVHDPRRPIEFVRPPLHRRH